MNKDEFKGLEKELQKHAVGDADWLRVLHKAFVEDSYEDPEDILAKNKSKEDDDADSLFKELEEFEKPKDSKDAEQVS